MKMIKKEIFVVEVYNKETRESKTKGAFEDLTHALTWCKKANETNEATGLDEFYVYEWKVINFYKEIEENEEGEE